MTVAAWLAYYITLWLDLVDGYWAVIPVIR
jgi:hypothetical protein